MWQPSWRPSLPVRCQDAPGIASGNNPYMTEKYRLLMYGQQLTPDELNFLQNQSLDPTRLTDSCTARAAFGFVGGGLMGFVMGGFLHTMQPPTDIDTSQSTLQQIKHSYKGFGQACVRMARNFSKFGFVYAGVECFFERERAVRDVPNAMYAGCVTGGILGFQGGPSGMAMGCAGIAAFSAVIELVMGH
eukprot:TRINITY_DN62463_c0_g1_i1.p1 TRINITY_DN62463_c0_g1~~TRINITY_DN62463_c0_g1_i1.p1  ORF type:complete len:189 (+),score=38.89 TRINITY_DN62463_c0_g1_i1:155-721(+)